MAVLVGLEEDKLTFIKKKLLKNLELSEKTYIFALLNRKDINVTNSI